MKIAVLNTNGIQESIQGKKQYYFAVDDNYDFNGNSATDVTSVDILNLFHTLLRITYCEYRDSLITLYPTLTYANLNSGDQIELCKNFIVDKTDRDTYFTDEEQKDNAVNMQVELAKCETEANFKNNAEGIINSDNTEMNIVGQLPNYKELDYEVIANYTSIWHKITLPDSISPNSIISVSCRSNKNKMYGGVRQVGSSIDRKRKIALESSFTLLVKVDKNRQIEVYAQSNDVSFYITAQLS